MSRQETPKREQTREQDLPDCLEEQELPVLRFSLGARPRVTFERCRKPDDAEETFCHQESMTIAEDVQSKDDSGTETDEDGHLIKQALRAKRNLLKRQAQRKQQSTKRRRLTALRTPGVTLKTLIDEKLISYGNNVLTLEYRGKTETADVDPDGRIHWNGTKFDSPSSFSIYVKRWVNPTRKADDGWKTVKHNGRCLEFYKLELLKRRCRAEGCTSSDPSILDHPLPSSSESPQTAPDVISSQPQITCTHDPSLPTSSNAVPFFCSTL